MTLRTLDARLQRLEHRHGAIVVERDYTDAELRQMPSAQLWVFVRSTYAAMSREHGSLAAAAVAYRADGHADLADLIEEDIHRERAANDPLA